LNDFFCRHFKTDGSIYRYRQIVHADQDSKKPYCFIDFEILCSEELACDILSIKILDEQISTFFTPMTAVCCQEGKMKD
jgi:hypothetical protein